MKKFDLKNVDWQHIGVLTLGAAAFLAKGFYEKKKFDANLDRQYNNHFEDRVSKIVDKKLKSIK